MVGLSNEQKERPPFLAVSCTDDHFNLEDYDVDIQHRVEGHTLTLGGTSLLLRNTWSSFEIGRLEFNCS